MPRSLHDFCPWCLSLSSRGVSRAGHTVREEIEQAGVHIQWRCFADHEAAKCALQPVVFTQSWKTRSNRQMFQKYTNCGASRNTVEYLCLASDVRQRQFFLRGLGEPRGQADWLNTRVFSMSNVRRVYNPPTEHKGRMAAVRLVCGDVDLLVVVACMWPEPCSVSERKRDRRLWLYSDFIISNAPGRSIPLLLLDASAHTGLQMVQSKVWSPVQSDAIGPGFPQRTSTVDNFVSCEKSIS